MDLSTLGEDKRTLYTPRNKIDTLFQRVYSSVIYQLSIDFCLGQVKVIICNQVEGWGQRERRVDSLSPTEYVGRTI